MREGFSAAKALPSGIGLVLVPGPRVSWSQPSEPVAGTVTVPAEEWANFRSRLLTATKHLDGLLDSETRVVGLKGRATNGETALT